MINDDSDDDDDDIPPITVQSLRYLLNTAISGRRGSYNYNNRAALARYRAVFEYSIPTTVAKGRRRISNTKD